MNTKRKWTEDEMRVLRELYPHTRTEEICKILNRSPSSVYGRANAHGIKKSQEFIDYLLSLEAERLKKYGPETRFQKGGNPGTKVRKDISVPMLPVSKKDNCQRIPGKKAKQD